MIKAILLKMEKINDLGDWMDKVKNAVKLFEDGFACAQAILSTYGAEFGLDKELALKIGDPFGAGMRGLSETCGVVTASFMVIGLKYGRIQADDLAAKEKTAGLVREFVKRFKGRHRGITCKELLGHDISISEQHDTAEKKGLFETKCPNFVKDAAEILEQIL
jgi:C_GCAxxG_C_C family probable redox protein